MGSLHEGATATTLLDGTVWVLGGADSYATEIYDPAAGSWSDSGWFQPRVGGVAGRL